jgi:hypothetical protein
MATQPTVGQGSQDPESGASEQRLRDEIAGLKARLDATDRNHDPALITSRTANIIGLISLMVILLGIAGGSGAFLQTQQSEIVDRRLDEFNEAINRIAQSSREDIDRQVKPLETTIKLQVDDVNRRFGVLESDLRARYSQDDEVRNVSVEMDNNVLFFRESNTEYCSGHLVLQLVNHTNLLTELVETRYYTKAPLIFGNSANLKEWDDVQTSGLVNSDMRMLVGNDVRPYYLTISVGRQHWPEFLADWTPEKSYPVKFVLSYIRLGKETESYTLERNVRVDSAFADCVRQASAG